MTELLPKNWPILIWNAKKGYFRGIFDKTTDSRKMFSAVDKLLNKDDKRVFPIDVHNTELCEEFSNYFIQKVKFCIMAKFHTYSHWCIWLKNSVQPIFGYVISHRFQSQIFLSFPFQNVTTMVVKLSFLSYSFIIHKQTYFSINDICR